MNTYDPFNTIRETFAYNLSTYGTTITVGGKTIKALFKLEGENAGLGSGTNKNQHLTMFTDYSESIDQGQEVVLNGKHYIVLKDNSDENTIYNRSKCIDCNQVIKYELKHTDDKSKADLTTFYAYGEDISAVNSTTGGIITIQSTCRFMFPLNDLTRRIQPNDRFYAGQSYSGVWKVRDLNYQNGVCDVYCIRDTTKETDDPDNMIANRWVYEHKPDAYAITLKPENVSIMAGKTQTISVTVTKNQAVMKDAPIVTYTMDTLDVVSIDPISNVLTGLNVGKVNISAKYEPLPNDTSTSNTIAVEVTEIPADTFKVTMSPKEIKLNPGKTQQLVVAVAKNEKPLETVPEIEYKVIPDGVATVTPTGLVTAVGVGSCIITGSYKVKPNDIAITDRVAVEVKEDIPKRIYVDPPYDSGSYYAVKENWGVSEFSCKAEGISSPKWDIHINPNGITNEYFASTINNAMGKFSFECKRFDSSVRNTMIVVTVNEQSSGLSIDYNIKLGAMF